VADQLGPSPVTCVVFNPRSDPAAANGQTLYAGTLAGVSVIHNARAATAANPPAGTPKPQWRTFNTSLPLVPVPDLETFIREGRRVLRCATYGRGVFECDLEGTPAARLYIRGTPIDDGRRYTGLSTLTEDPRVLAPTPLDPLQAFDIRVDAPPLSFSFDGRMDGVEFDEELVPDLPVPGQRNVVYVQVHNGGVQTAAGVEVRLFAAEALGDPPVVPDLPANFCPLLESAPPLGAIALPSPWLPVGAKLLSVPTGQPVVADFDWIPPLEALDSMALLAVCSHADDRLSSPPAAPLPQAVGPLVRQERRAALRLTPLAAVPSAVYIRDGVDDDGQVGAVSWGGRSPDIIVVQAIPPNRGQIFADLTDPRLGDHVRYGVQNLAYVRVHNRSLVPVDAEVRLYRVPLDTLSQGVEWSPLGLEDVNAIPPRSWKLTPAMPWSQAPALAAATSPESFLLLAVARRKGDPPASFKGVKDLAGIWQLAGERDSAIARFNSIALRGLLIVP
jgi:hypothetical protein